MRMAWVVLGGVLGCGAEGELDGKCGPGTHCGDENCHPVANDQLQTHNFGTVRGDDMIGLSVTNVGACLGQATGGQTFRWTGDVLVPDDSVKPWEIRTLAQWQNGWYLFKPSYLRVRPEQTDDRTIALEVDDAGVHTTYLCELEGEDAIRCDEALP